MLAMWIRPPLRAVGYVARTTTACCLLCPYLGLIVGIFSRLLHITNASFVDDYRQLDVNVSPKIGKSSLKY